MEGEGMPDALHVRVSLSPSITIADAGEIETCDGSKKMLNTKINAEMDGQPITHEYIYKCMRKTLMHLPVYKPSS